MAVILFDEQTTDATSDTFTLTNPRGVVEVSGTFDGATVTIQMSLDGTTWTDADTSTSASLNVFQFIKHGIVRAVISNADTSTSLMVQLEQEY